MYTISCLQQGCFYIVNIQLLQIEYLYVSLFKKVEFMLTILLSNYSISPNKVPAVHVVILIFT